MQQQQLMGNNPLALEYPVDFTVDCGWAIVLSLVASAEAKNFVTKEMPNWELLYGIDAAHEQVGVRVRAQLLLLRARTSDDVTRDDDGIAKWLSVGLAFGSYILAKVESTWEAGEKRAFIAMDQSIERF